MRWGDMDAMGHINNTVYFRYYEQARIAWFEELGMLSGRERGHGPILASVSCDFVKPLQYPGELVIDQKVTRLGNSSVAMDLTIERRDQPGVIWAKGQSVIVWMDYASGRAIAWPQTLRDLLGTEPQSEDSSKEHS